VSAATSPALRAAPPPTEAPRLEPAAGTATVALLGRPNSGKSSLYNVLTGGEAKVGNFPGVTVDILEGSVTLPDGRTAVVADLPGLYSIDAVIDPATDEGIARGFLDRAEAAGQPLLVAQVIDATQLALGLRLTHELARSALPLLVVVTQADVLEREGRTLDVVRLEATLGAPVVLVSARDPACRALVLDAAVRALARPAGPVVAANVDWDPAALARRVLSDAPEVSPDAARRRTFTTRVDGVLLHSVLGPFLFLAMMALVFAAVFLVAEPVTAFFDGVVGRLRAVLEEALGAGLLTSFLADGLVAGAGTVLAYVPQIAILTLAMEVLDASGYLARGAFLLDRLLRLLGLSGRSFLPLLMGHACAIPAISATRIIRDPRERLTTILVVPLMTCSARLPTYALILTTFFAARGVWFKAGVFVALYFAGILSGLVASLILRRTATKGRSLPLLLEMPAYRMPEWRVVLRKGWQSAVRFVREVGRMIVLVAAVLWVLLKVPAPAGMDRAPVSAPPIEHSIAAAIGHGLEPVTRPLGFDWRIDVGLIGSFGAREVMVGTMGVIFGIEEAGDDVSPLSQKIRSAKLPDGTVAYSSRTALALLAFFVLACQCMSTVAAIRRETKSWRWPAFVLAYTYGVAYVAALLVYQVGGLLRL
jgi:ferrous iron transport protein B